MHKHGDSSQPNDIDEWLDQFHIFDIYKILPDIVEMWEMENEQMSVPKKEREIDREMNTALFRFDARNAVFPLPIWIS